jgi:hypothetical protein
MMGGGPGAPSKFGGDEDLKPKPVIVSSSELKSPTEFEDDFNKAEINNETAADSYNDQVCDSNINLSLHDIYVSNLSRICLIDFLVLMVLMTKKKRNGSGRVFLC